MSICQSYPERMLRWDVWAQIGGGDIFCRGIVCSSWSSVQSGAGGHAQTKRDAHDEACERRRRILMREWLLSPWQIVLFGLPW